MTLVLRKVDSDKYYDKYFKNGLKIARGAFGAVFQVINRKNGKVVAVIKRVDLTDLSDKAVAYNKQEVLFFTLVPVRFFYTNFCFLRSS